MIASALSELVAAATSTFPGQLALVGAKYAVTLVAPGAVQPWFAYETDQVRTALLPNASSIVSVRWAGDAETQLARPSAGVRDTTMRVIVAYVYKDTDANAVENHVKYVPEAIAQWLDVFPIASRSAGKTITKIAPPLGKKITMRQKKEDVREANGITTYLWHAEAEFDVEIRDVVVIDPYAGYLAFDSVTRANSTTSPGSCTEKGGAWTALGGTGTWGVIGDALYSVTGLSAAITLALTAPAGAFGYRIDTAAIQFRNTYLALRFVDLNNYLVVTYDAGAVVLYTMVAGVSNARMTVANGSSGLPAFGAAAFICSASIAANVVSCFVNGARVGTPYTLTAGEIAAFASSQNVALVASGGGNGTASTVRYITATP